MQPLAKYLFLSLFLVLVFSGAHAQAPVPDADLNAFYDQLNAYQTARYQPLADLEQLRLPADFSGADLQALHLGERQIVRIDLVYSAFRLNPAFSQRQLNLSRIRNLAGLLPGLLQDETVTWTLVEQTGCTSPAACHDFFHGFVVYADRRYTAATSKADIDSLTRRLNTLTKKLAKTKPTRKAPGKRVACNFPWSRYTVRQMARRVSRAYSCKRREKQIVKFEMTVDRKGNTLGVALTPTSTPLC
ncbi:MAG: hypothetical protein H7Z21_08215, partial [Hymenobacter sp.]|nr:hypothetical protein [Hymenobacter sp.]